MNTGNYDNEATTFEGSNAINPQQAGAPAPCTPEEQAAFKPAGATPPPFDKKASAPRKDNSATWKQAAAGAAGGLLIGGASAALMGMAKADTANPDAPADDARPDWAVGDVKIAENVSDDMSFNEAFAAARAEVGPGGAFEWHGGVYGTYTAQEWNSMSAAERAEYGDNFNWNHLDQSHSNVAQHSSHASQSHHAAAQHHDQSTAHHTEPAHDGPHQQDDDIHVTRVDHPTTPGSEQPHVQPTVAHHDTPSGEIEVIGVVHDDSDNTNVGFLRIDGHDAVVIDVDNDLSFDVMGVDVNGDGHFQSDEAVNIQGQGLTVASLGGFSDQPSTPAEPAPTGNNLYANNDPAPYDDPLAAGTDPAPESYDVC